MEKYFDKVKIGSQEIGIAAERIKLGTKDVLTVGTDYSVSIKGNDNEAIKIITSGTPAVDIINTGSFAAARFTECFTTIGNRYNMGILALEARDEAFLRVGSNEIIRIGSGGFDVGICDYNTATIRLGSSTGTVYIKDKTIEEWCSGGGSGDGNVVVVEFGTGFGTDVTWQQEDKIKKAIQAKKAVLCTCDATGNGYTVAPLVYSSISTSKGDSCFKFRLPDCTSYGTAVDILVLHSGWSTE